jgi:arylsulfatase A
LKARGLDQNTLLLLTSDNGDENSYYKYTRRFAATGPLRAKKRFLYEGGIRVPLIARWPGTVPVGQATALPAAAWDLMATLADLAGVAPPAQSDGVSLVPTLLGKPEQQREREYLYWEFHQGKQQAVRMGRWKGVRIGGTMEPIELYDLETDIGETRDVAEARPEVVARIAEIMAEARAGSEYNRFWPLPERRMNQIRPDRHIYDQLEHGT